MKKITVLLAFMLSASPVLAAQQTILGGAGVLWGDEKVKINSNFSELYGRLAQALLTTSSPTFVDLTLTSDLNLKDWIYFTSDDDTHYVAVAAGNNTANYILRWPTAAPGGSNYLLNFDADGTGGWTDPSTLGGDDLGSATYSTVTTLWASGSCSGYLKSDGTCDTPSGAAHDAVTLSTDLGNNLLGLSTQQLTLDSQTANYIFAAPNGSAGVPSFRALVAADIPTLNQNTTGTAGGLSGTPAITVSSVTIPGNSTGPQMMIQAEDTDNGTEYTGVGSPAAVTTSYVMLRPPTAPAGSIWLHATPSAVTDSGGTSRNASAGTWVTPGTGVTTAMGNATNGSGGLITYGNAAGAAAILTGYTSGAGAVAATDTILQAIQKLNGNVATKADINADTTGEAGSLGSTATTGKLTVTGPAAGETRVMTVPDANFTVARTDAANSFTGNQTVDGIIRGRVAFNSYSADQTLTAATHNSGLVQFTAIAEATMWDCETANVGDTVMLWARDAEKIEVVPASGDQFYLFAGTGIGANDELDIAATAGTKVVLMCTADDTWSVVTETAACTDGGSAD